MILLDVPGMSTLSPIPPHTSLLSALAHSRLWLKISGKKFKKEENQRFYEASLNPETEVATSCVSFYCSIVHLLILVCFYVSASLNYKLLRTRVCILTYPTPQSSTGAGP